MDKRTFMECLSLSENGGLRGELAMDLVRNWGRRWLKFGCLNFKCQEKEVFSTLIADNESRKE